MSNARVGATTGVVRSPRRAGLALTATLLFALAACAPAPVEQLAAATPTPPAALKGTGLVPEVLPAEQVTSQSVAVAPPVAYDLTAWAPPAGDQGSVGSCVAWSIAYTALGWYQRRDGIAGGALAPMYTYAQLAKGVDNGSTFSGNLNIARTQGIDTQSDYQPQGNFDFTTQPTAAQRANAAKWKLSSFRSLAIDQMAIQSSISTNHPVVIGIPVYSNFFSVGATNRGYYAGASGSFAGYHALTALGYDATGLRVLNSWSARWGDAGYATLSWDFVRNNVFTAIEIGAFAPGAPTTTPASTTTTTAKPVVTTTTVKPVTTTTVKPVVTTTTAKPVTTTTVPSRSAPSITGLAPTAGALTGGQVVTISGAGLSDVRSVTVGGVPATGVVTAANGASLKMTVPPGTAGYAPVTVTTGAGSNRASAPANYRYLPPTITTMGPTTGPTAGGKRVTVTGTYLNGATVRIGSVPVAASVAGTGTSLSFTAPAGTGTASVSVTVGGTTVTAGTFTFVPPPSIVTTSAARGRANTSTIIRITGTNFGADARVVVGTRTLTPLVAADGRSLAVNIPASAAGSTTLAVTTASGTSNRITWTWY